MNVTVNGINMGYDDVGGGVPVVFLHGFPHDRSLWRHQRSALTSRVRCVVPDLRGFGVSTPDAPYSIDQYADDVVALMDAIDVESAAICGLSMGGYIAMAMWRRHPTRVKALMLCDTKMTPDDEKARNNRNVMIDLARTEGSETVAMKLLPGMVGAASRERSPNIAEEVHLMMARQPVDGIVGALSALRDRADSRATLESITVPTLVVVGEDDVLTPPSDARAMIASIPASTHPHLEFISGAGHVSCLERPAAVTHALADFLATLSVH